MEWLQRAADLAIGRFEIDEGLGLLHRALDLETDERERVELWRSIAQANVFKFDGEAFWTAMLKALDGADDRTQGDIYSILAFHTATRAAMWRKRPAHDLIAGWIDKATELSQKESPARARALIARAYLDVDAAGTPVREAVDLATRLGDLELQSWALGAGLEEAMARGEYEAAFGWAQRREELLPRFDDPDHIALLLMFNEPAYTATTRFEEARRVIEAHDEVTKRLTPHHRMHAAALFLDIEWVMGNWDAIHTLTPRVEDAVGANIATPCAANVLSLMTCAIAHVRLDDAGEARRLERSADEIGMEGYRFDAPKVEIAVARGDLTDLERRLATWRPEGFWDFDGLIARLNGLIALGRREDIEQEAAGLRRPGSYLDPFVTRALGFARRDETLIEEATGRFEELGLSWHAAETGRLLEAH